MKPLIANFPPPSSRSALCGQNVLSLLCSASESTNVPTGSQARPGSNPIQILNFLVSNKTGKESAFTIGLNAYLANLFFSDFTSFTGVDERHLSQFLTKAIATRTAGCMLTVIVFH